jgi:hypothetical protein
MLIARSPEKFYRPPYVGVRGWVGIELKRVSDEELAFHLHEAWRLIAPETLQGVIRVPGEKEVREMQRAKREARVLQLGNKRADRRKVNLDMTLL